MDNLLDIKVIRDEVKVISEEILLSTGNLPLTIIGYHNDGRKVMLYPVYDEAAEKKEEFDAVRYFFLQHDITVYAFSSESWLSFDVKLTHGSPSQDPNRIECLLVAVNDKSTCLTCISTIHRDKITGDILSVEEMNQPDGYSANTLELLNDPSLITTSKMRIKKRIDSMRKVWLPSVEEPLGQLKKRPKGPA